MDLYEAIKKRRSIRQFKPDPIDKSLIDKILEAATWAPSGKNLQNWYFYVVTGQKREELLKLSQKAWLKVRDVLEKRLKPSLFQLTERFFYTWGGAPVVLVAYSRRNPAENNQTAIGSVYMAVQNLLLAATAEGLGTCTLGSTLEIKDEANKVLGVNDPDMDLVCGIAMGWPDQSPPPAPRQPNRIKWVES